MRRKICFLTDSVFTVGGVQRVTAVIAMMLSRSCDVTIVCFDNPRQIDTSLYGLDKSALSFRFISYPSVSRVHHFCCKAYSGFYRRIVGRWQHQPRFLSALYARSSFPAPLRHALVAELRNGSYDVIVGVHAPLAARLATIARHLTGVKMVGWIHNSFEALFGDTSFYIGSDRKRHYAYQFRQLDKLVVLCHYDAEAFFQYDHLLRPVVIYNPLTLLPGSCSQGTSRQFLAVGRFSPLHKGFDILIEAFHLFAKHDKEWTLHIVGEGPEEVLYRQLISRYELQQRVLLHPFTQFVQSYYSQAQVYVLSSRWEGFGLVLVEAMAHGLPVVSSNLPTSREIMGEEALYFETGNVEQLAERLLEATRMDWPSRSARALDIARRFDADKILRQWLQIVGSEP